MYENVRNQNKNKNNQERTKRNKKEQKGTKRNKKKQKGTKRNKKEQKGTEQKKYECKKYYDHLLDTISSKRSRIPVNNLYDFTYAESPLLLFFFSLEAAL